MFALYIIMLAVCVLSFVAVMYLNYANYQIRQENKTYAKVIIELLTKGEIKSAKGGKVVSPYRKNEDNGDNK